MTMFVQSLERGLDRGCGILCHYILCQYFTIFYGCFSSYVLLLIYGPCFISEVSLAGPLEKYAKYKGNRQIHL